MEIMKCTNCKKELTGEMEIEYSEWLSSYFCHPDCAKDYYFNEMQSVPFLPSEKTEEEFIERNITVIKGKLYIG